MTTKTVPTRLLPIGSAMTEPELHDLSATMAQLHGDTSNAALADWYYRLREQHLAWVERVQAFGHETNWDAALHRLTASGATHTVRPRCA